MKRGESGLSMVVGVRKPSGMTSHDVVSRVRRIFGEKRVGHAGTLDPMATGVLAVCVGSATRLNEYLTAHDKNYRARIVFGFATDTDDAEGSLTDAAPVPAQLCDPGFAASYVSSLVGPSKQLPPLYSAIKVDGRKACDEARKGRVIHIEPRDIEVYEARLFGVEAVKGPMCASGVLQRTDVVAWDVAFRVSKGTYIRSLARDMGTDLGCYAHLGALERTVSGELTLDDCCTLEALEAVGERAALDPVRLLGKRFAYVRDGQFARVENGGALAPKDLQLFEYGGEGSRRDMCACTTDLVESFDALVDGELVSLIGKNRLVALYAYDAASGRLKPDKVLQGGVSRGYA